MKKAVHLYFFKIKISEILLLLLKEYQPFLELFLDGLNTVLRLNFLVLLKNINQGGQIQFDTLPQLFIYLVFLKIIMKVALVNEFPVVHVLSKH